MLRLFLVFLAATFTINSFAQIPTAKTSVRSNQLTQVQEEDGHNALEYQLIDSSGLMSLSQQVKYSAQQFIQQSSEVGSVTNAKTMSGNQEINHAQHFAIAKSLAKRWTEDAWQKRLLDLIHEMPVATQKKVQAQLAHPLIQAAQSKERQAIEVQHTPEYQLYINKLRQRPPSASRTQLIENLDKSFGFSDMLIKTRAVVIKEISHQVKGWNAPDDWKSNTKQEVLDFLFYAYRKTPNSELKRIAQRFNQPELNNFYRSVRNAI